MPRPRTALFNLNYLCNQKCYYCFWEQDNKGFMPAKENVFQILKQLQQLGIKAIEYCGGGEPLMTPYFEELIKTAYSMGFRQGLLTNGVLFKGSLMETFLDIGTYVRISLDTVNPETYKKIRGVDHCKDVLNNIFQAISYKKKNNSVSCEISIKLGIAKEIDVEDIKKTFAYFEGWGLDNIQIKNLWGKDGLYLRDDIKKKDLMYIDTKRINTVRKVRYSKYMSEPCWLTPVQVTVDAYGDVYLCCYYMNRKDSHKLMNVFDESLNKFWGSAKHKEKIEGIKIKDCLKHDCRFQKYMKAIAKNRKKGNWYFV